MPTDIGKSGATDWLLPPGGAIKAGGDFGTALALVVDVDDEGKNAGGVFVAELGAAGIPVDPTVLALVEEEVPNGEERAGGGTVLPFASGIPVGGPAGGGGDGGGRIVLPPADGPDMPPILANGLIEVVPVFDCAVGGGRDGGAVVVVGLVLSEDGAAAAMVDK